MDTHVKPEVLVTTPDSAAPAMAWMRHYPHYFVPASDLRKLRPFPELMVVQAKGPASLIKHSQFLSVLAEQTKHASGPWKVVFLFVGRVRPKASDFSGVFRWFPTSAVEFAQGSRNGAFAIEEAWAKLLKEREETPAPKEWTEPRDPLCEIRSIIGATADLRTASGRLSAARVADAFGLSVAEVAKLLGKTRQAISKTEDASSLQKGLRHFERIARLKAVLSVEDFRKWLNMPRPELDELAPLDVVREGKASRVADLAEHMLTGVPV